METHLCAVCRTPIFHEKALAYNGEFYCHPSVRNCFAIESIRSDSVIRDTRRDEMLDLADDSE